MCFPFDRPGYIADNSNDADVLITDRFAVTAVGNTSTKVTLKSSSNAFNATVVVQMP